MSQPFSVRTDWNWIARGLNLFAQQWLMWVLSTAFFLAAVVFSLVGFVPIWVWFVEVADLGYVDWLSPLPWIGVAVFLLGTGIASLLYAGLYKSAERQLRGEPVRLQDLLLAADRFPTLIAVQSVVFTLVLIGCLFCLLPGLIVGGLMFFSTPAVVLGKRGFGEAMKESYRIVAADIPGLMVFGIVTNVISGVGANICYIGLLASIPVAVLITTVAYYDCAGIRPTDRTDSASPPA